MKKILTICSILMTLGCSNTDSTEQTQSILHQPTPNTSSEHKQNNLVVSEKATTAIEQDIQQLDLSKCQANTTQLSIFAKDDFSFDYYGCNYGENEEGNYEYYIKEYLRNSDNDIFVYQYPRTSGTELPIIEAVSIYKPAHKNKWPLLIIIHGELQCCYPRPSGTWYEIKLYQIKQKLDNTIDIHDVTQILGEDSFGFDGQNDNAEPVTFNFKDIASIKAWLKDNY